MEIKNINGAFAVLAAALVLLAVPAFADIGNGKGVAGLAVGIDVRAGAEAGDDDSSAEGDDGGEGAESGDSDDSRMGADVGVRGNAGVDIRTTAGTGAEVIMERYDELRQRASEARGKYLDARVRASASIEDFNTLKARFRLAGITEKIRLRAELRNSAQHVLENQVNAILNHLAAIEGKQIEPDNFAELEAFFEAKQQLLVDGNMSQEALISVSAEIRDFWRGQKLGVE